MSLVGRGVSCTAPAVRLKSAVLCIVLTYDPNGREVQTVPARVSSRSTRSRTSTAISNSQSGYRSAASVFGRIQYDSSW
jgi:hypothetical protein